MGDSYQFCGNREDTYEYFGNVYLTKMKTHDSSTAQDLLWVLGSQGPGKVSFTDFTNIVKVLHVYFGIRYSSTYLYIVVCKLLTFI